MYPLLESLCFKNGQYQLLPEHQARVNRAFAHLFPETSPLLLKDILPLDLPNTQTIKVRLIYGKEGFQVDYHPYEVRKVRALRLVEGAAISYKHKYTDRSHIAQLFERREAADDIIICKNGLITDSSYANLAFLQNGQWYTPNSPLLHGVKRQHLLKQKVITEQEISMDMLSEFEAVSLINAMLDLGEVQLSMSKVKSIRKSAE